MSDAFKKTLKEFLRIVVFGGISAAVAYATTQLANLPANNNYVIVGTLVLRFVDKWIHENQNINAKGLLPF